MSGATGPPGTHKRIRPFNTKDTYPEQNLDNDLCQAVVAGGVVYLRGQIGQDLDTRESVGIGDVEAQAEKAMANIAMLLSAAGSSLQDIVKVTVYLIDIRYREPVYRVMGRWLKGVYPVSTGLVVSALARPEWLVEIDATAVLSAQAGAWRFPRGRRAPAAAGAVLSQTVPDPRLGPKLLGLLGAGASAATAIGQVVASEPFTQFRQL